MFAPYGAAEKVFIKPLIDLAGKSKKFAGGMKAIARMMQPSNQNQWCYQASAQRRSRSGNRR